LILEGGFMLEKSGFLRVVVVSCATIVTLSAILSCLFFGYTIGLRDQKFFDAVNIYRLHQQREADIRKKNKRKQLGYYTVRRGDSIEKIAREYIILKWQLRQANDFKKGVIIHPGQKIKIPRIDWSKKSYVGKASWYGPGFHGKKMANGQVYNQNKILIAHRTLPLGLKVRITNLENGSSIVAKVLDRGPYTDNDKDGKYDREVDLSFGAAKVLGSVKEGVVPVLIEPI